MKKILFPLFALLLAAAGARADDLFDATKKYAIVCNYYGRGSLALGANHGSSAYVYYYDQPTLTDDCYWYIEKDGDGYVLRNAKDKTVLTYDPERIEGVAKGIKLADDVTSDAERWTFHSVSTGFYIANVQTPAQCINVRHTDGTQLVGTYATPGDTKSENECFRVYDEDGKEVTGSGTVVGSGSENGNCGVNDDGSYWELTGLAQPVVYTTDTSNPVLYTIKNVRSGNYAYATYYGEIYEQSGGNATKFYFVETAGGVNIFTENGLYVRTYSATPDRPLATAAGSPSAGTNVWSIGFYREQNPGYSICRLTDRETEDTSGEGLRNYWNDYVESFTSYIGLYACDGGSTFVFSSDDNRHIAHLVANGIRPGGSAATDFPVYVDSLRIDGKDLVFDTSEMVYYCSLPPSLRGGKDYALRIEYKPSAAGQGRTVRIDGIAPSADGSLTLPSVTCLEDYTLELVQDGTEEKATAKLRFTFLPIVEVNVASCNGSYYNTGSIRVTDGGIAGYDSTFVAAFKYRGASAQNYSKKSYAVKLRDADGNSVDRSFFGLRDDNNWILDAMAVDHACMRNRVSTDLWNEFSSEPYHRKWEKKARTGTRGRFVEVFLNGAYHGLYCMTEKVDRKQLKLKKLETDPASGTQTLHGSLYKSVDWSYEVFMGHESDSRYLPKRTPTAFYNNSGKEDWCGYEVKYPDYEEEPVDWEPLWNAINFVATAGDEDFNSNLTNYFDYPVLKDYYLFIELMLATDNHGKNMFFYNYDQQGETEKGKIGIAPWDLDGTWGRRWDGSSRLTEAGQDFTTFLWDNEHGTHTLFIRLAASDYILWDLALKDRYAQLRTTYFDEDALKDRFTAYSELFAESGAAAREEGRWNIYHSDIAGDVDYITGWIHDRLAYLDEQYGYTPPVVSDGVGYVSDDHVGVRGGRGCIIVHASGGGVTVRVYSVSGQLVRTVVPDGGLTTIDGLVPGVYVVNGKKVIVE